MSVKAGVIGWPIHHSKSPLIHNHWLELYGIQGAYDAVAVAPENLGAEIKRLVREKYVGFNVTVPHKQTIMPYLDFIRADAERIGAVNTVVVNANGALEGRNTDAFGFTQNLTQTIPNYDFANTPVVVIGAGGAARAIVYGLQQRGARDIRITNRTHAHARILADAFGMQAFMWESLPDMTQDAGLIVNTTTLGMIGQPALELDFDRIKSSCVVADIVYNPLITPLLAAAQKYGHPIVTGIGMLLHQARPAFEAWYGILPDIDEALKQKVLA